MKSDSDYLTGAVPSETVQAARFSESAMPTQGGTYVAWRPEYQSGDVLLSHDGWRMVPTRESESGVPGAGALRGINHTICMFSFAQANALAWSYAAAVEAETGRAVEVRVVEYQVKYDIKCYRALEAGTVQAATSGGTR